MKTLFTIIFILTATQLGFAQYTLTGQVLNGSQDSTAVADMPVLLAKMSPQDNTPVILDTTQSAANGNYRFQFGDKNENATYFTAADFAGVRYYSGLAEFTNSNAQVQLVVHDTTHSTANISTFMHHIIVDDMGESVHFRETHVLNNPGNATITNVFEHPDAGPATFEFTLPSCAENVEPVSPQVPGELVAGSGSVIDKGVMPPGNRQVTFTYECRWEKNRINVTTTILRPTRSFDVFVANPHVKVFSEQFQDLGNFNIRGHNYHRYGVRTPDTGMAVRFELRRSSEHLQSPLPAIGLTAGLLALGLAASFVQRKKE